MSPTIRTTAANPRAPAMARHTSRLALVVLLLLSFCLVMPTSPASAWVQGSISGRPGSFYVPKITGSHFKVAAGVVNGVQLYVWKPAVGAQPLQVTRSSAAAGVQTVSITFRLSRWNGSSWATQSTSSVRATLGATQSSGILPAWWTYPTTGGSFMVSAVVVWTSSTGAQLGLVGVAFNGNDYVCSDIVGYCSSATGYVTLR